MRVIVLGAGGRLGSRVLAECVRQGHEATAFVRSAERLRAAVGPELLERVAVVEGDVLDAAALRQALSGQEACVQASGYIGSTYEESKPLQRLVQAAVEAANETLVGARRLWVLGGAGELLGRRRPSWWQQRLLKAGRGSRPLNRVLLLRSSGLQRTRVT